MHPFTIDFITGNTADFKYYGYEKEAADDQNTVPDEENYFNTTQNLEDIYSVIRNDPALTTPSPGDYLVPAREVDTPGDYLVPAREVDTPGDYLVPAREVDTPSPVDYLVPAREVDTPSPGPDYLLSSPDVLDRGTPSPTQDSGIESTGSSPVQSLQDQDVKQKIDTLEKKAHKLTKSSESTTEKPGLSYIAMIARAILSAPDRKMTLGDIYKHIRDNHSYYDNEERAWRNSIRYNLSINECFIKAGKEESGKGNYWAIHEQCLPDFENGDYRRRQARRRARRGTRVLDSEPAHQTTRNVSYAPMTPSYIGYHPYGPRGMMSAPAQPFSSAPQQFYQSQRSTIAAPTPTYFHGNQVYHNAVGYSGYPNFMTSPYSYMTSQGMEQKQLDTQKYLQNYDRSNTVIINTCKS